MALFIRETGRGLTRPSYRRLTSRSYITVKGLQALRHSTRARNKALCSCGAVLDLTEQAFSTCIDCMLEVQPC